MAPSRRDHLSAVPAFIETKDAARRRCAARLLAQLYDDEEQGDVEEHEEHESPQKRGVAATLGLDEQSAPEQERDQRRGGDGEMGELFQYATTLGRLVKRRRPPDPGRFRVSDTGT